MSNEIEEFLKRAAQRRTSRKPPEIQLIEPEVIEAEVIESQTSQHLAHSDFARRASQLGEEVGLADEHLEAHLHEKFGHRLGRLAKKPRPIPQQPAPSATPRPPIAALSVAEMLRNPQSLRNAIVLREILDRPEHLW
jgi:hypothetical protein